MGVYGKKLRDDVYFIRKNDGNYIRHNNDEIYIADNIAKNYKDSIKIGSKYGNTRGIYNYIDNKYIIIKTGEIVGMYLVGTGVDTVGKIGVYNTKAEKLHEIKLTNEEIYITGCNMDGKENIKVYYVTDRMYCMNINTKDWGYSISEL